MVTPNTVYPRLRGGSMSTGWAGLYKTGLSPPTRGIPRSNTHPYRATRSIPAYAGDPQIPDTATRIAAVYPRLRGGSGDKGAIKMKCKGLSPPTRGILPLTDKGVCVDGSIPAYAGDPLHRLIFWRCLYLIVGCLLGCCGLASAGSVAR